MAADNDPQTKKRATVAFRVTPDVKRLVQAAAARRGAFVSEVLRRAIRDSLREEFGPGALTEQEETEEPTTTNAPPG